MAHGNGCPMVRHALQDFKQLRSLFNAKGVEFWLLNSQLQDSRDSIVAESTEYSIDFPILKDKHQLVSKRLGITRTSEVLIMDLDERRWIYRGPLNDRLSYEKQRNVATQSHVQQQLESLLAGNEISFSSFKAKGCIIHYASSPDASEISYSKDIAPILKEHCVQCHRKGGIGPWNMNSHKKVLGFSYMIREVLLTKRMPPWHADPEIGHFSNDVSLSPEEKSLLLTWIEAGAKRGSDTDPLAQPMAPLPKWPLGKPDKVIKLPEVKLPATGTVDYIYVNIPNPWKKDIWLRGVDFVAGDSRAVHHCISSHTRAVNPNSKILGETLIGGHVPGNKSHFFPKDMGIYIPKGGQLTIQMHYTTYGKASIDLSEIAFYYAKKKPSRRLRTTYIVDPSIEIPAHAENHRDQAYMPIFQDIEIISLLPHAHFRGKSSKFTLRLPSGEEKQLLSVPNYDFNWQRSYYFNKPVFAPAGSKLVQSFTYDNSSNNPANPDPSKTVRWGEQSWEEMLFASVQYRLLEEPKNEKPLTRPQISAQHLLGYMDEDLSGLVDLHEQSDDFQKKVKASKIDRNGDQALDLDELIALISLSSKKKN